MGKKNKSEQIEQTAGETPADVPPSSEHPPESAPPADVRDDNSIAGAKARWVERRTRIDELSAELESLRRDQRADDEVIGEHALERAKAAGGEAVVMLGSYRVKAKRRPAKHGGGIMLVDAEVSAPLDI